MTEIKLHNTRTRAKEIFHPIDRGNVRIYACGPTVYDRAHIGNARSAVVFDVLVRLMRHVYPTVTYVRNFTDVDDKIIDKARATLGADESLEAATKRITDETIDWYRQDMAAIGCARPDHEPRCTEMIPQMVAMIETLIAKEFAYPDGDGHVLFEVREFEPYGDLANRSVDDMIAGARVEVATNKRDPMDFVLWKPSSEEQPGWDSPWGRGRPGWHIECSAMAKELLGEIFDIHAGGIDLAFPHHENEIAQSCCAHGTDRMANYWIHNEMLRVEGEKMSKSLGNFFTVRDLLDQDIPGEVIRLVLLSAQYRSPLDWTADRLLEAKKTLREWRDIILGHEEPGDPPVSVLAALSDDLNFPGAIAELHRLAKAGQPGDLFRGAALLGLLEDNETMGSWVLDEAQKKTAARLKVKLLIEDLLSARTAARNAKDFARADAIRDGFLAAGVILKDRPEGPEWDLAPNFDPAKLEALR
ncbi:MAG: cysteine--tRNA ligase [Pseudomonadota bacterium]